VNYLLYQKAACLPKAFLFSGSVINYKTIYAFTDQRTFLYHSAKAYRTLVQLSNLTVISSTRKSNCKDQVANIRSEYIMCFFHLTDNFHGGGGGII
jgi:hypothetical protein